MFLTLPFPRMFRLALGLMLVAVLFSGCGKRAAPTPPPGLANTKVPEALQSGYKKLVDEGERNWVLNLNELAVPAMRMGERELAERCLSESILNINSVFGSTPEAEKARLLFFSEDTKLFKGEPHERAMTFLYRGILHMQTGDYEAARANFRSGVLQDAFAEEAQNRADWVIFDYLIAYCEQELGRPGFSDEAWQRAERNFAGSRKSVVEVVKGSQPLPQLPRIDPKDNLLIICQQGGAPRKVLGGSRGQYVGYRRGMNAPGPSRLRVADQETASWLIDSLYYQATTRGGRPFDSIQKRKVVFKDSAEAVGTIGLLSGLLVLSNANNSDAALVGVAIIGVALVIRIAAELTKTTADDRQWQSIPDSLSIRTASINAPTADVSVYEGNGTMKATVPLAAPGTGITIILTFPGSERALLVSPTPVLRRNP